MQKYFIFLDKTDIILFFETPEDFLYELSRLSKVAYTAMDENLS